MVPEIVNTMAVSTFYFKFIVFEVFIPDSLDIIFY